MEKPIVFFDGVCGLCNKSVDFLLRKDKNKNLLFSTLQGEKAKEVLESTELKSIVLYDKGKLYYRSSAVLKACTYLSGGWKALSWFRVFPRFLRDFVYDIVAKNRYKWFGKKESCRIPTPEERGRFVD